MSLLEVSGLSVEFDTPEGVVRAVTDLNFKVDNGTTLAIVGESGSGKSQAVFSLMGLLAHNGRASGSVKMEGEEMLGRSYAEMNRIRANKISMIFQDPMTSLNPYMRISDQMAEVLVYHKGMSRTDAIRDSIEMLDAVKIPSAKERIRMYPHEFSGGMRQRVMIAMSLLCRPRLLIADEPTTALDVTIQAQIMRLLGEIQRELGTAIILITHDLGVVAGHSDEILVMYGGRVMEMASTGELYRSPAHPYTQGLLTAVPRLDHDDESLTTIPGTPPNMMELPKGCPFSERCQYCRERCLEAIPVLTPLAHHDRHLKACFATAGALR